MEYDHVLKRPMASESSYAVLPSLSLDDLSLFSHIRVNEVFISDGEGMPLPPSIRFSMVPRYGCFLELQFLYRIFWKLPHLHDLIWGGLRSEEGEGIQRRICTPDLTRLQEDLATDCLTMPPHVSSRIFCKFIQELPVRMQCSEFLQMLLL